MEKIFNITGTCIPEKHYMVDISGKVKEILSTIEEGFYFTINRPMQYGKTTTLFFLKNALRKNPEYLVSSISFEGVGDVVFHDEITFSPFVLTKIADGLGLHNHEDIKSYIDKVVNKVHNLETLSSEITSLIRKYNKWFVLIIDEVDKNSNNRLFLSFLEMLRNKYLLREQGDDYTFHSVILAGVHDIKNLKCKLYPDAEQKYNSPWNISTVLKVDLSFNPTEISTMLYDYTIDTKVGMDIDKISERIYHYTCGYPFLVSRICKEMDENIFPEKINKKWTVKDVDEAVRVISEEKNTNFETLTKHLENNQELYELTKDIATGNLHFSYSTINPAIQIGVTHGILRKVMRTLTFHNKIYEEIITNYITSKLTRKQSRNISSEATRNQFVKPDGRLDMQKVLLKFQKVIKKKYSQSDVLMRDEFLEKDLRLLFLVFLKPIINGIGFSFKKEVERSVEKRLDIVVIFKDEKFVIELKLWRGGLYHRQGIAKLKRYMKREGARNGYMLIMDKSRFNAFAIEQQKGMMMVWI